MSNVFTFRYFSCRTTVMASVECHWDRTLISTNNTVNVVSCLTKYYAMKTYPVLNQAPRHDGA